MLLSFRKLPSKIVDFLFVRTFLSSTNLALFRFSFVRHVSGISLESRLGRLVASIRDDWTCRNGRGSPATGSSGGSYFLMVVGIAMQSPAYFSRIVSQALWVQDTVLHFLIETADTCWVEPNSLPVRRIVGWFCKAKRRLDGRQRLTNDFQPGGGELYSRVEPKQELRNLKTSALFGPGRRE
jgi:hypothetical protein